MAGVYTRMSCVIEGHEFYFEGSFQDTMQYFNLFLRQVVGVELGHRPAGPPPPRSAPRPRAPKPLNWRKTLGFPSKVPVTVLHRVDIDRAFRELVKKLRPDLLVHGANQRQRDRWDRVVAARDAALREVGG